MGGKKAVEHLHLKRVSSTADNQEYFRGGTMLGRFNSGKVSFAKSRRATGRTNLANKNFPSAGNEQFQKNTFRILRNYIVVKLNK